MDFLKKYAYKILFLLFIIGVSFWGYKIYNRHKEIQNRTSYAVTQQVPVFLPQQRDIVVLHNYIGRVEAINDTPIIPYISGYIVEINAVGGQHVKKGDVMMTIKQDEYIAAYVSAVAELYAAKAEYLNAKIKYERTKKAGVEVMSQTALDDAKTALISAKGALEKAKASCLTAQTNLEYTYLTAPFDGVIGNINASLGDFVSPQGTPLARLIQNNPIRVVFSVSDKEFLNEIINAQSENFKVRLANGKILPQSGKLSYTANAVDKDTNSIAVYSEFENSNNKLMPDAYVDVLQEKKYKNIVLIPKNLLQLHPNGDFVYTVYGDVLQLHKVKMLAEYNNKAVVKNNFRPKEYIAADVVEANLLGQKVDINQIPEE